MTPQIVQIGTYSSANKGDAAMQISCLAALRDRWPDAKITVSAPFPAADAPVYQDSAHIVPCNRRRLVFSGFQLLRCALWRVVRKFAGMDFNWLIPEPELQAYREADLVIDLSGDMLTDEYGFHVAISHYIPIFNALLLARPVFVCAQSIGPFKWTRSVARLLFQYVAAISVRDRISLGHLSAVGIGLSNVSVTADMAFLLPTAPPERAGRIMADEAITTDQRGVLGVSVSPILEARYERSTNASFSDLLAQVLDDFSRKNNAQVLFVPHVTGPKARGDDRRVAGKVASKMREPSNVIRGDYRPEELKALIAGCELFLGARMHANIAALSASVPVVALSYSHKTPGIMALFEQQERVIDGEKLSADRLGRALQLAWDNRGQIRSAIAMALPRVRSAAARNLELVARILGDAPGRIAT